MTAKILDNNFSLLKTHHRNTYRHLVDQKIPQNYVVSDSQSGHPTLIHIDSKGDRKYLLSKYNPLQEAENFIKNINIADHTNFIILGMGLGYQAFELLKHIPESSKVIIIETDKHLARLAFETLDFSEILLHPGISFIFPNESLEIQSHLEDEKLNLCINGYYLIQQNALSEVNREKSNRVLSSLKIFMQESTINFKTQKAKSKIFCNNLANNFKNMISSAGIDSLESAMLNIPAVICSAGPSLDKNIQFLKAKRNNFILISVATALKALKANDIAPDFIVAIDPEEITLKFFDFQGNSLNSWLVYNPVVPSPIPSFFKGKRLVYDSTSNLSKWLQKNIGVNGSLGKVFSVAHAAFQFTNFIGCSPKIFIGQDFSFEKKRLHSKNSYYYQKMEDQINQNSTLGILNEQNFHKYADNIIDKKSIFSNPLFTTMSLDSYANIFSDTIEANSKTYNSSEGGIGINKIINIPLREALNLYCTTNISNKVSSTLNSITLKSPDLKKASNAAKDQIDLFNLILDKLDIVETALSSSLTLTDRIKEEFIQKMNEIIQSMLNDKETTLFLQDYNFSGFSIWNQRTNQILKKKNKMSQKELIDEEFKRDHDFYKGLRESVEFNISVFDLFYKEASSA